VTLDASNSIHGRLVPTSFDLHLRDARTRMGDLSALNMAQEGSTAASTTAAEVASQTGLPARDSLSRMWGA
jgi:hypothetical protein